MSDVAPVQPMNGVREPLFVLDGVDHWYGNFHALDTITLAVEPGPVGLLGPNGAGKTTLLRTLLGLLEPDRGSARVLGHDTLKDTAHIRRRVGYMPENECYFGSMTGLDAVIYAGRLAGLPNVAAIRRAHEVLDYAGLGEARYRETDGYSTGMKQRVKLAQALVHGPDLLFLDEPTNGLDPRGRDEMLDIIEGLGQMQEPISVVLSSHLLGDVERVCDRVVLLAGGKLRHYGRIADMTAGTSGGYEVEVRDDARPLAAALGRLGILATVEETRRDRMTTELTDEQLPMFWEQAVQTGVQVRHFAPVRVTLEKAFMDLLEGDAS